MKQSLTCSLLEQQRVRVLSNAEFIGRSLLRSLNVNESKLRVSDTGCLRTEYKYGLQEIHSDFQEFKHASECYVVIFYLVNTKSTAVADVKKDELDNIWKMNIKEAKSKLSSIQFLTERVDIGDTLIMNGKCFHYGVANPDTYQRFIGFLSFTPLSLPPFDSQDQSYPPGIHSYRT